MTFLRVSRIPAQCADNGVDDGVAGLVLAPAWQSNLLPFFNLRFGGLNGFLNTFNRHRISPKGNEAAITYVIRRGQTFTLPPPLIVDSP